MGFSGNIGCLLLLCFVIASCTTANPTEEIPPSDESIVIQEVSLLDEAIAFQEAYMLEYETEARSRYGFDETMSQADLAQVGEQIQRDFRDWLQIPESESRFDELVTNDLDSPSTYQMRYVQFKNAHGLTVRGVLSVPQNDATSHPIIIIPTGSNASPYQLFGISGRDYHNNVGGQFAEPYIVFAVDIPNLATETFLFSNISGMNWLYYQTCDRITPALDFALTQAGADESHIAIYGISLGGWASITGAACDDRFGVIAASGTNVFTSLFTQVTSNRRIRYPSYYLHDAINRPDFYQVPYSYFPRPMIIELNDKDSTGVYEEALANANSILQYYALREQPDLAHLVLLTDDSCAFANQHHCMEVSRVKMIIDDIFEEGS